MSTPHVGRFFDNVRMTKPCFCTFVDALSSRVLLPQGQTARVNNIEKLAILMQTVGMHRRQRDSMEQFQHSLETIHRRFHRVLSILSTLAPKMITRSNWTNTYPKIASNPDFYPYFKDCIGAIDGTLVPAWAPQADQNRYRSRKGRIVQNVLAICDFDMNFTHVYVGWEGSAADARVLDHAISQVSVFPFPPIAMTYAALLTWTGFPQEEHWSLEMESRSMWMILDANAAVPMPEDSVAEGQMAYWSRAMRSLGCYLYTREQIRAKFYELKDRYRTFHALTQEPGVDYDCNTMWIVVPDIVQQQFTLLIYPETLYPSMLKVWGRTRAGCDLSGRA
ncbi:UNVERIFIED_CONTAM: hypothetical protein Sradi_4396100 [Sesamum radiatum]|uniref:DDE Tnp4 domain-containing protein n=1 Tax=Sesamum radiatum TaxID=300843 RepID=A0AAW2NQW1_SESRA